MVTPNQQEAERLLGRALLTRGQYLEAVARIRRWGRNRWSSHWAAAARWARFRDGILEALPPRVDAVSPIGSGDALAAAFPGPCRAKTITWRRCAGAWPRARRRPASPV